jgi:hypothetical protein
MIRGLTEKASALLPGCPTLWDAEQRLGCMFATEGNFRKWDRTAEVWGLFDGFYGRPHTDAGVPDGVKNHYREGYAIGRKLNTEHAMA